MKKMYYCPECDTIKDTKVIKKEQTLNVKGRDITLCVPVRICTVCGEEIYDKELDSKTIDTFYKQFRIIEKLLLPEEIKSIRQKYNLSQASFAKFLGFGEKTITRYENGAIQDACHDNLIRLMNSTESFALLWEERKDCLSDKEQIYIESILTSYKRKKIHSTYNPVSVYCSSYINNKYSIDQGAMSYAN